MASADESCMVLDYQYPSKSINYCGGGGYWGVSRYS